MKPASRRELVKHLQVVWGVSMKRACAIVGGFRSSLYDRHKRDMQAVLRQRIREVAETRVKWGYRSIHVLPRREGWRRNAKRVHRLYCLEGLQLRNKTLKPHVPHFGCSCGIFCIRASLRCQGRGTEEWATTCFRFFRRTHMECPKAQVEAGSQEREEGPPPTTS